MVEPTSGDKILCTLCQGIARLVKDSLAFVISDKTWRYTLLNWLRQTNRIRNWSHRKKTTKSFLPGSTILSFGTAGCNLGCKFCQNWSMSKAKLDDLNSLEASPEDVVNLAKRYQTPSIAFTYNDQQFLVSMLLTFQRLREEKELSQWW